MNTEHHTLHCRFLSIVRQFPIMRFLLLVMLCSLATATYAGNLLFSGATFRSNLLAPLYTSPDGFVKVTRELRSDLLSWSYRDSDVIMLDLKTGQYSLFRNTKPFDVLVTDIQFHSLDLTRSVAVQLPGSGLFLVDQNRTSINQLGSVVYVGPLRPSMHRFLGVTPPSPPDFEEDGLPDAVERALGLSSETDDTDKDGILDVHEDSDGDGYSNEEELAAGTDPGNYFDSPGINECALGTDSCDVNASCMDTSASYSCECNVGYFGDGYSCEFDDGSDSTVRVSLQEDGSEWSGASDYPAISLDGDFVVYTNYTTSPANCYIRTPDDSQILVNVPDPALAGQPNLAGECVVPVVSRYGGSVAFNTDADNLLQDSSANLNGANIYLRIVGTAPGVSPVIPPSTMLVSRNTSFTQNSSAGYTAISDNGRFVIYESNGSGYTASDTNGVGDVFLFDVEAQSTELVSVPGGHMNSGLQATGGDSTTEGASVTDNGRYIAFSSWANGLDSNDTSSGVSDVFLRDRLLDTTIRISNSVSNSNPDGDSYFARMDGTGRFIAFQSAATNLTPDDTNNVSDIFLHDTKWNTTIRISTDSSGGQLNDASNSPDINTDGRFVTFVVNDAQSSKVMLKDLLSGELSLISHTPRNLTVAATLAGNPAFSVSPTISGSSNNISYLSDADNILEAGEDTNTAADVFVHEKNVVAYLPHNSWQFISLPSSPPAGQATVQAIFGDDIGTTYGDANNGGWVVFGYDEQARDYVDPGIDGILVSGNGYWIIQLTGAPVTLDMPAGSTRTSTYVGSACVSSPVPGCFNRNLQTVPDDFLWNAIGNPFYTNPAIENLRITTSSGDCSDADGCTPDEAADADAANVQHNIYWTYDDNITDYVSIQSGDTMQPWTGYWNPVLSGADGIDPVLHIPRF